MQGSRQAQVSVNSRTGGGAEGQYVCHTRNEFFQTSFPRPGATHSMTVRDGLRLEARQSVSLT